MYSGLTGVVIVFGVALAAAWLMRALRAPAILGFLLAGIVIGPSGLRLIDKEEIHFFAELGLVLLLFTIGLELSPGPLLRMGQRLLAATSLQVGITTLLTATVLRLALSLSWTPALIAGVGVSLSSTAIVLKTLSDRGETDTPTGALATGILLIQDIVVILVLILLPLFTGESEAHWVAVVGKAAIALVGLACVTYLARLVLPWLVNRVFRHGGQELMTLFAVAMALTGAWLADLADWSWPLGACIAGLLLAQTDLRHQLCAEITPFRDVFNALFFISIGMLVDLRLFGQHPFALTLAIVLTLAAKTVLTAGAVRVAGWPLRLALASGLGLCTISEFGYVLVKESSSLGLVPAQFLQQFVAWAAGTMLLGAVFVPTAGPLAAALTRRIRGETAPAAFEPDASEHGAHASHVIIIGYGVNGRNLARVLQATRIPYVVIEMNRANAQVAREDGGTVIVGDAARMLILNSAGLATARALVISIADQQTTRRIVAQVHRTRPDVYILARTRYVSELDTLYRLGAAQVIPEEFETSIELFAHLLKEFAIPDNIIEQQVTMIRGGRYAMLRGRPSDRALRAEWTHLLEAAVTQTFFLMETSPACGRTIREIDLRARTSVLIVAVTRDGKPTPSPGPDFRLEAGDVLVLVGTHHQLDAAKAALEASQEAPRQV
jgi:CPA2 family monovalent cation:H+ antiporter-2